MSARLTLDPDAVMLSDGGLETVLIFEQGVDLPAFAAFPLLLDAAGTVRLERYYLEYRDVAADAGAGFVLETPTWRAHPDWAQTLGHSVDDLGRVGGEDVAPGRGPREGRRGGQAGWVSGCIGPRGDGYRADAAMSAGQAAGYPPPRSVSPPPPAQTSSRRSPWATRRRPSASSRPPPRTTSPVSWGSPWRRTAGCRPARPWWTRCSRSTKPRGAPPPGSWSTALIRTTSSRAWP